MTDKFHSKPFYSTKEEIETKKSRKRKNELGYTLAFTDQAFLVREELRPIRLQLELLKPELILQDNNIEDTIVFFGSAQLPAPHTAQKQLNKASKAYNKNPDDLQLQFEIKKARRVVENSQYLKEATKLAYLASSHRSPEFVVVTGGGPSFMEAANKGAYEAKARSIALNISLPTEQEPNPYVTPELTFQFHYFAIRKLHFLMRAKALIAFPGGFGTLDEVFEVLNLMQKNKIKQMPIILFNKSFWTRIIDFPALAEEGTIDIENLNLFTYVETAEEAWKLITDFYCL